jgi:predicted RNA binding protein YcfA (HicA-like mRNA interferase family)
MAKPPALSPKKILKALLRAGFYIHHQSGSHIQLRHTQKSHLRITIPYHSHFDLPSSVVNNILKQAEISKEEF